MALDDPINEMRKDLRTGKALVVARVAARVAEANAHALLGDLKDAFARFLPHGEKTDKGCLAKLALIDALGRLECSDAEVFLRGMHHVQKEPVWGKPVDTAANLRANCALALVYTGYSQTLFELVTLLGDSEVEARRGAVKALELHGSDSAELLLRLKALDGDKEEVVVCDCLTSLMAMAPSRSLSFVEPFLDGTPEVRDGAAMALGQSRLPEALAVLLERWVRDVRQEARLSLLLPIALVRLDESFDFLLELVRSSDEKMAIEVLKVLQVYDDARERRARVRDAVDAAKSRVVARAFREIFEPAL